jgi:hypothetical protein
VNRPAHRETVRPFRLLSLACFGESARAEADAPSKDPVSADLKSPPPSVGPLEVSVGLYVLNLGKINQADETFDIVGLMTTSWKDPRLGQKAIDKNVDVLGLSPNEIWLPQLTILNAATPPRQTLTQLSVTRDGTVKWVEMITTTVSADFNLRRFPFDSQTAKVIWEPLASEVRPIKLVHNPKTSGFSKDSYVTLSEWDIEKTGVTITEPKDNPGGLENWRSTFELRIKRNYGFYLFKIAFPMLLICIISWTTFWINPATSFAPQMTVGITSMLVAVTFNLTISSALPRVPYATLMDGFISVSYLFFFASLLSTVYFHTLINQEKKERAMSLSRTFRWLFPTAFVVVQGLTMLAFVLTTS